MSTENIQKFIEKFVESLEQNCFVKLNLGNHKGADAGLQKILIRTIEIKNAKQLSFVYRFETKDTTKNYEFSEAVNALENLLGKEFFAAHLFTTKNDWQLEIGKKNVRLNLNKSTFNVKPGISHNREKKLLISPAASYLQTLGITDERGKIKDKQQDKWRQINKFVEIVGSLFDNSLLKDKPEISIVDMGSGKGYLTFAVYDYFNNLRQIRANIVGVEARDELVSLCNDLAKSCNFENLKFEKGFINNFKIENVDVLIALHACNTATDDAIFAGINANSSLIIAAPCCHKEIRPQIKAPEMLKNVLKHGSLMEREAETLTDGLRALLLERESYATKVFEFIAAEHTAKNNLIVGVKREKAINVADINRQIEQIKEFYSIREHHLEKLLQK